MASSKRTVLITGCSDGGLGAALAVAFHNAGLHVYATARSTSKMTQLASLGIETLSLDIQSSASIASLVAQFPGKTLDILVNNAGAQSLMPVSDVDINAAKELFDLNVWAQLAVTQAFLPLLMRSEGGGTIVNQTSVGASTAIPFQIMYDASKAAMSMISAGMRLELEAFGLRVIDLRTGVVKTNLIKNWRESRSTTLPAESIWGAARESVERALRQDQYVGAGLAADEWAQGVVGDVLKKNPPKIIWRGESAFLCKVGTMLPLSMADSMIKGVSGLSEIEKIIKAHRSEAQK